jgi:multiple antibiotic resistance protein
MNSLIHFYGLVLATIVALLPIINPLASMPVFLAITEGDSVEHRRVQAKRGCLYMVGILVSFLIGGSVIMRFFGLSIPGLRIAGGLLVCGIAMTMFAPPKEDAEERKRREEARAKRDISFTPLAMPMLSGPGSIAVTIGLSSLATEWHDYMAIILGILVVAVISYITLRLSSRLVHAIGVNALSALTKIMAFLLLCIGIQFVVNGVVGVLTDPSLLDPLKEALHSK